MICTFHSLCLRILQALCRARSGCRPTSRIYRFGRSDQADQGGDQAAGDFQHQFPAVDRAWRRSATPRTSCSTPEAYADAAGDFYQRHGRPGLREISAAADAEQRAGFRRSAAAHRPGACAIIRRCCAELQDRFQYILIDEYQDTNHAQYVLAHALALRHRNICVVGDPDQSIYAWRGADIQNILDFEKDYPDAKVVRLEQNYRSTKTILRDRLAS